ncbi:MAG TPA: FlgD immunoglobulin-like domain containing protein, partial [Candidatus Limnocylindrales bacterium]
LHDTTPREAGIAIMPPTTGDAGFVVAWRATDDSAIRSFDVQVSVDGGAWVAWRSGTRLTSDVYPGADGHGYAFRTRATDAYGNVGAWDVTARFARTPRLAVGGFGRVRVDGISARVSPGTSALGVATLSAGQLLAIIGGPVSADGYTWYEVTGPLSEWNTVAFTRSGIWVAARSASTSFVAAAQAPGATLIDAAIDGLRIGTGAPGAVASFSPNGDRSADSVHLAWRNNVALSTIGLRVYRLDGSLIGTRALPRTAAGDQTYDWDGALAGIGRPLDGRYVLQLVGTAGTKTYSAPSARPVTLAQIARYSVVFDRVRPVVTSAGSTGNRLSPNGDGRFEAVAFRLSATGGSAWNFSVVRLTGATTGRSVRSGAGIGSRVLFTWNGRADSGAVVADGTYRVTLRILDQAGNWAARAWTVLVDARPPVIAATASPSPISPNGDGTADSAVLHWASSEPVSGTVSVRHGARVVRGWSLAGRAGGTIAWNGRDAKGHTVPDGAYRVRVDGFDATGNRTIVERTVVVDGSAGFLRWATSAFDPQDGDQLQPTSRLTFRTTRTARVSLAIVDARGVVVRGVWAARTVTAGAHGWTWDGRGTGGAFVAPGSYTAILTVTSPFGTTTLRRAVFAGAYLITPLATTLMAGTTLTLAFRTIETLRGRPVVTFRETGLAPVSRTATRLSDGSYRVTFPVRPGKGPASVLIAAVDSGGHVNRQALGLVVR